MSLYTSLVSAATKKVEDAEKSFLDASAKLKNVRTLNGQQGYDITINGARVSVASMDPHTYMAVMNRGCEMMHLGAIKVLDAYVDAAKDRLLAARAELVAIANRDDKS